MQTNETNAYNENYVRGLLDEIKDQLEEGRPTMKMKNAIRDLLELTAPPPPPPQKAKSALKKSTATAAETTAKVAGITAECCVCGQETAGQFYKRGFKCVECRGNAKLDRLTPGSDPHVVTSADRPREFAFMCQPREDLLEATEKSIVSEFESETSPLPALERFAVDYTGTAPDQCRYCSFTVPLTDEVQLMIPKLRRVHHPNIVHTYAIAADEKRGVIWFTQETAPTIASQLLKHFKSSQSPVGSPTAAAAAVVHDMERQISEPTTPGRGGDSLTDRPSPPLSMRRPLGSSSDLEVAALAATAPGRFDSLGSIIHTVGESSNTASPSMASLPGGLSFVNTLVEYELFKKISVSLLHALRFLHEKGFLHGDIRPHNVTFDESHLVKLRYALFPLAPLGPPFCAPEALELREEFEKAGMLSAEATRNDFGADFGRKGSTVANFVKHSKATPAWDVYMLGVTLTMIAYGDVDKFPPPEIRNAEDDRLIALLSGLTAEEPSQRLTVTAALDHPYLASVRLVNGVPAETVVAHLIREEDVNTPQASRSPSPGRSSPQPQNPSTSAFFKLLDKKSSTVEMFDTFLKEHGPDFQIVKPHPHSITLYSIKSDPRRRRAQVAGSGSSSGSTGASSAGKEARKRSVTLPPTAKPAKSEL